MTTRRPRTQPYSERGIARVPCCRCGKPSRYQWQVCADGRQYRGVCSECDIALNQLVFDFMRGIPRAEAKKKMEAYKKQMGAAA